MKPDGRSLDIVVVGLGQGGGNIATEFFRRGYPAVALNTAESDLHALDPGGVFPALPAERRLYIGMDGYDGAGADPEYGSQCVAEHADAIREFVRAQAQNADAVLLSAGLGGGTGSSLRALVAALEPLALPLVALMTLPTDDESGIVKVNAVRAVNELIDAPMLGWIFVDNQRLSELNQDVSIVDYFAHVNDRIASPIDGLNRLNDREDVRSIRSFDGEDLRKLLLSGGVLNYGTVELPQLTADEVVGALRDALDDSELMPRGFDVGSVSYLGWVVEAPEAALAGVPMSTFQKVDEQVKRETGGAAVYRGIYRTAIEGGPVLLRFMAACQALPARIRELIADARKEGSAIRDKLEIALRGMELGEVEDFELFRPGAKNRVSERPKKLEVGAPDIEDLRVGIMRPQRPAQSPLQKRASSDKHGGERGATERGATERGASGDKSGDKAGASSDKPGPAAEAHALRPLDVQRPADTAVPGTAGRMTEPAELARRPKLVAPPPPKPAPAPRPAAGRVAPAPGASEPRGASPAVALATAATTSAVVVGGAASTPASTASVPPPPASMANAQRPPTPSVTPPAHGVAAAPQVAASIAASTPGLAITAAATGSGAIPSGAARVESTPRLGGAASEARLEPRAPEPTRPIEPKAPPAPPPPPPRLETPIGTRARDDLSVSVDDVIDMREDDVRAALDAKAAPPAKRHTVPLEIEASSLLEEPNGESVTHEIDLEAERVRVARVATDTPRIRASALEPPSPELYDRLVSEFLRAADDDIRDDIAERLEADAEADETVVRYYAVEAMAKLGRETFGTALLAATEDEDDAVRAMAIEALRR